MALDLNRSSAFDTYSYPDLTTHMRACTACPLSDTRTQVVVGSGPTPCSFMIIGEGPGQQEDASGLPFVGRSGQLLTKILSAVGIDRDTAAFIANIVKCRPPGNRNPHASEIEACRDYLIRQIQLVQPKVIALLGAPALKSILAETQPISAVRGRWYQMAVSYMDDPLYLMPLFHPSYLLRHASREEGSPKWLTWQDMKEIKAALDFYA